MVTGIILQKVKQPPRISAVLNIGEFSYDIFYLRINANTGTGAWMASVLMTFTIIFGVIDGKLGELPTSLYVSFGHTGKISFI